MYSKEALQHHVLEPIYQRKFEQILLTNFGKLDRLCNKPNVIFVSKSGFDNSGAPYGATNFG